MSILDRLGWRRDLQSSTVRYQDGEGNGSTLVVSLVHGYVKLEGATFGPIYLSPLQVNRVRGALRTAVLDLGLLSGEEIPAPEVLEPRAVQPAELPSHRRAHVHATSRMTVADIMARLGTSVAAVPDSGQARHRRHTVVDPYHSSHSGTGGSAHAAPERIGHPDGYVAEQAYTPVVVQRRAG